MRLVLDADRGSSNIEPVRRDRQSKPLANLRPGLRHQLTLCVSCDHHAAILARINSPLAYHRYERSLADAVTGCDSKL